MNFYWNPEMENDPVYEMGQKMENLSLDDKNFGIRHRIPKIFKRYYTKHSDFLSKKIKKPVQKNAFQDTILNFSEQVKNIKNILELQNKFNVTIEQKNGQRKLGPLPANSGPQPGPGCEIFVGRIPRNIYEDVIYPIFLKMGDIYEMRLMMNFSGTNRGFCFIMYKKPEMAQRAIKELNNFQIRPGWFIGVVESVNNCRLHVTDLPSETKIKTLVKKVWPACEDIDKISLFTNISNPQTKHALISFRTHRSAAMARRRLLPERNVFFDKSEVRIEWAHPKISLTNVYEEIGIYNSNTGEVVVTKQIIKKDKKNYNVENNFSKINCKNVNKKHPNPMNVNKLPSNLNMTNNIKNDYVLQFLDMAKHSFNENYKNICNYPKPSPYYINNPSILNTTNCSVVHYPWLKDQLYWRKMMSARQMPKENNFTVPTFNNNENFYNADNVKSMIARPILNSSFLSNQYRSY